MGTIDTQEIQLYTGGAWGATSTNTVRLMGIQDCQFTPNVPSQVHRQLRGSLGPGALATRPSTQAGANVKGIALYEDINYWFENLFGTVSPSGSNPYVRAGVAPLLVSSLSPRQMVITKGDADGAYAVAGALVDELTLTCEQKVNDSQMMFEAKLMGKSVASGTVASLSDRVCNPIMAADFAVKLDAYSGTPGTTAVSSTVYGFQAKFKANRVLKPYLGSQTPGGYDQRSFVAEQQTLQLMCELNATSKAFLDSIIGATPWQKIVRLVATNGALIHQMDFGIQAPDSPPIVEDRDGVKVLKINGIGFEASGLGNWFKWSNTTAVATLP